MPLLGQSMSFYSKLSFQDTGKKPLKTEKAVAASGPTVSSLSSPDNMNTYENVADSSMCSGDQRWFLNVFDTSRYLCDCDAGGSFACTVLVCILVLLLHGFLAFLVGIFVDVNVFSA